jgi:hypothetical protein
MARNSSTPIFTVLVTGVLCLQSVSAEFFQWVDEYGQVHFSDRVPPQYSQVERKVYNQKGHLTTTIQPAKTKQELKLERQRLKAEEIEQEKIQAKKQLDWTLLMMFTSVKEMESTRDERSDLFKSRVAILEKKLEKLRKEQSNIEATMQSAKLDQAQLDQLKQHQVMLADRIKEVEDQRDLQLSEKTKMESQFAQDIERFIELTRQRELEQED